jgi:hypothetical protein
MYESILNINYVWVLAISGTRHGVMSSVSKWVLQDNAPKLADFKREKDNFKNSNSGLQIALLCNTIAAK